MFKRMNAVLATLVGYAFAASLAAWADDMDGDGVDDVKDVCEGTPSATVVDAEGRPLGDIDLDCDTDSDDFALFQQGLTGPLAYVVIDTVPVGNPGNADDIHGAGYGGVAYVYEIGKYEVTAEQYCAFLNAVASTDTHGLYSTSMWSSDDGCKIERSGSSGSFTYSIAIDWANRPVNYVSWGDAARFANWLHNGQPRGGENLATTEDGSYYLNGAMTDAELLTITREVDATWVIPSEDEWYKAAYHHNDGVTGNYWDYPMRSDTAPTSEGPPGTDMTNGSANCWDDVLALGPPFYRTKGGAYDAQPSDSPYGTFDQGGNVWEWTEAVMGSWHGLRGGSYDDAPYEDCYWLHAANRTTYGHPPEERGATGFRVARIR